MAEIEACTVAELPSLYPDDDTRKQLSSVSLLPHDLGAARTSSTHAVSPLDSVPGATGVVAPPAWAVDGLHTVGDGLAQLRAHLGWHDADAAVAAETEEAQASGEHVNVRVLPQDVRGVINVLRQCKSLSRLSVVGLGLSDMRLGHLVDSLLRGPRLHALRLGGNEFGRESAAKLRRWWMAHESVLLELSLSRCGLQDEQLAVLLGCLTERTRLEFLSLADNALTNAGVRRLVCVLPNAYRLRSVWLSGNRELDDEIVPLLEVVLPFTAVETMRVARLPKLSREGKARVKAALLQPKLHMEDAPPLPYYTFHHNVSAVVSLVEAGFNPLEANEAQCHIGDDVFPSGCTARDVAKMRGHDDLVEYFEAGDERRVELVKEWEGRSGDGDDADADPFARLGM